MATLFVPHLSILMILGAFFIAAIFAENQILHKFRF